MTCHSEFYELALMAQPRGLKVVIEFWASDQGIPTIDADTTVTITEQAAKLAGQLPIVVTARGPAAKMLTVATEIVKGFPRLDGQQAQE